MRNDGKKEREKGREGCNVKKVRVRVWGKRRETMLDREEKSEKNFRVVDTVFTNTI